MCPRAERVWPARQRLAHFLVRPNRFTVAATLGSETVLAHLPSTGRLGELLVPGAPLLLTHAPSPGRKTAWDVTAVFYEGAFTGVDTRLGPALAAKRLEEDPPAWLPNGPWRSEVAFGTARFDFGQTGSPPSFMEVKTVTLVEQGVARFPDAPTERGAKHLRLLSDVARSGGWAGVWFLILRPEVKVLRPHAEHDPAFAEALSEARSAGVVLRADTIAIRPGRASWGDPVPLEL